jgi:NADH-dependent peroxiredoxin subunit F
MYELIVIGPGPAGMTAAVYAARKKLNALVIGHDLGGRPLYNTIVTENENGC